MVVQRVYDTRTHTTLVNDVFTHDAGRMAIVFTHNGYQCGPPAAFLAEREYEDKDQASHRASNVECSKEGLKHHSHHYGHVEASHATVSLVEA